MQHFKKAFGSLADPRAGNARHDLLETLFVALAAVLCGATSCSDMEEFGLSKERVLRLVLRLEHGIPSHDTFSRVFRLLNPRAFEAAFRRFMAAFAEANGLDLTGVVAIDGKALCGAYERGGQATPLQLVSSQISQSPRPTSRARLTFFHNSMRSDWNCSRRRVRASPVRPRSQILTILSADRSFQRCRQPPRL